MSNLNNKSGCRKDWVAKGDKTALFMKESEVKI